MVKTIAKRAEISTGQLYTWRKELVQSGSATFTPVVAVGSSADTPPAVIELEARWGKVRIPATISPEVIAAIIGAMGRT